MNTHALFTTKQDGNTIADCLCGWYFHSTGTDATSRRAAETAYDAHETADTGETVHWKETA